MGVTLLPLASLAVDEELFLSTPEEVLKTAFFPESEALGPGGSEASRNLQQRKVIAALGRALPAAAGGDVEQRVGQVLWVKFVGSCS